VIYHRESQKETNWSQLRSMVQGFMIVKPESSERPADPREQGQGHKGDADAGAQARRQERWFEGALDAMAAFASQARTGNRGTARRRCTPPITPRCG